jgi:hypothetical protein
MRKTGFMSICLLSFLLMITAFIMPQGEAGAKPDDKKDIKITIMPTLKMGNAPLPVRFVAEVVAPEELDKYIYESSAEWKIYGSFVLTDMYSSGGTSSAERNGMGRTPMSSSEAFMRGEKHLVTKSRKRAPRKKYKEGTEVKKTFEFAYKFKRPGTYYITFSLRRGKFSSKEIKIQVKGDTSFDPYRDKY